jgi:hypothetical protein
MSYGTMSKYDSCRVWSPRFLLVDMSLEAVLLTIAFCLKIYGAINDDFCFVILEKRLAVCHDLVFLFLGMQDL